MRIRKSVKRIGGATAILWFGFWFGYEFADAEDWWVFPFTVTCMFSFIFLLATGMMALEDGE